MSDASLITSPEAVLRSTRPARASRTSLVSVATQGDGHATLDEDLLERYAEMMVPVMDAYAYKQRQGLRQIGESTRAQEQAQQVQLATRITHSAGLQLDSALHAANALLAAATPVLPLDTPLSSEDAERRDRKREAAREGWRKRKRANEEAKEQDARNKLARAEARRKAMEERARMAAADQFPPTVQTDDGLSYSPSSTRPPSPSANELGKGKRRASKLLDGDHHLHDALGHATNRATLDDASEGLSSPPLSPGGSVFDDQDLQDVEFDALEDGDFNPEFTKTKKAGALSKLPARTPEELERRIWTQIARSQVPRAAKLRSMTSTTRSTFNKRLAMVVSREARRNLIKTKSTKEVQTKAKRVMREMLVFWKGNEKREREGRKAAEKQALDKVKKEEELREAKRAARKLNFLITQTELYSHFVGSKVHTDEAEESSETAGQAAQKSEEEEARLKKIIEATQDQTGVAVGPLGFEEEDEAALELRARQNAEKAVNRAKEKAAAFDAAVAEDQLNSKPNVESDTLADRFDAEMDLQHPNVSEGSSNIQQPTMLNCQLKDYQLKGLRWLANLYEQGINGILADEMGLGKTVQSISLMAYLAEQHNIWGPFLVVAPASTLHNWQQEITRFVPGLKALPYWGNVKDRTVLRKFWNRKSLRYDKDAPFHVLVTSYQLVVADEKYFQRVKWQYMILDEAQAIKSASSARWKTLLGFNCRNRLLLTGTPIQNSMQELWALLHFIMPSLFDSHDEFSDWFSKDIEGSSDKNGGMSSHQLKRLHMILKPFMLRRIKKNVQNELGDKVEIDIKCDLTPRQRFMYQSLRENISINELIQRASSLSADDAAVKRLMNLIMQFRKVCNHPELFERADVWAPVSFVRYSASRDMSKENMITVLDLPYSTQSHLSLQLPRRLIPDHQDTNHTQRLFSIWTSSHIQNNKFLPLAPHILDLSPSEVCTLASGEDLDQLTLLLKLEAKRAQQPTPLWQVWQTYLGQVAAARQDELTFIPSVSSSPPELYSSDRRLAYKQRDSLHKQTARDLFFGLSHPARESEQDVGRVEQRYPGLPVQGLFHDLPKVSRPAPPMRVPNLGKLILDSGKLAKLDELLPKLRAEGHKVLVYFQMTRMIDLMEEYLAFRQYKYLRLDGSSTISERRDMVMDWQTRPELFIFLLSTRAGGLGINLTAADTVIFYDCDWNPSNDAQAMDRAHRLGQTKQVTVYRLITAGTIDERILQLARNKKAVQDAVVGSSSAQPEQTNTREVVSLLLNDDELQESLRLQEAKRLRAEQSKIEAGYRGIAKREENRRLREEKAAQRDAYSSVLNAQDDDEDAFSFFVSKAGADVDEDNLDDDDAPSTSTSKAPAKPASSKSKGKAAVQQPKKIAATALEDGAENSPKKKRLRRTKAELEELDRLGISRRTGKPKKKATEKAVE